MAAEAGEAVAAAWAAADLADHSAAVELPAGALHFAALAVRSGASDRAASRPARQATGEAVEAAGVMAEDGVGATALAWDIVD